MILFESPSLRVWELQAKSFEGKFMKLCSKREFLRRIRGQNVRFSDPIPL